MEQDKNEIQKEIEKLEAQMMAPEFWSDKNKAQSVLKELQDLKNKKEGKEGPRKYDRGNAVVTIISGAGGDDAEDFSAMLLQMYLKYAGKQGWSVSLIHENKNEHGGYRNVAFEISSLTPSAKASTPLHNVNYGEGKGVRVGPYGTLKHESGVHRLVRISPFNAKKLRHTSFSLVEVLPKFSKLEEKDIVISDADLKIEFSRSSGPGGQNVNKRETAVRVVHVPSGLSVHASGERSQEQNREQALAILRAKIFKRASEQKKTFEESMKLKNTEIEWGNQIRSYVLHPYKMVKDHRTDAETANVNAVLDGEIDLFIDAEKNL
ncbi:MAG: peptide chain release factor-like protein [Patescibacteria group bacterium]